MEYYRKLYINSSPQKDEKSLISDFVKGLLPEIKLHILGNAKGPEDMSEALRMAVKWEELLQEQGNLVAKKYKIQILKNL